MSNSQSANTKRIAKNTLLLYVRKFFSMLVSLYTARVVLKTLGVEDYGISSVVGGVIGMIGFLNDSMSGATSRFLTYELGRGDKPRMKETFATA
jgi:O-antigen/teichoic acid export membrane protein